MTRTGSSPSTDAKRQAIDWPAELARHERWLRTVAAARLGNRDAVDEVMQEVALAAVAQRAPLHDPDKVAPWLYRLAVTQSLLYRRKLGRQRRLTERYAHRAGEVEGASSDADPLGWLLANERRQLVRMALDKLPHRDREMLLLKYREGWNYRQLADHLGVSHSAVETRLHRARAKLRDELGRQSAIAASSST